METKYYPSRVAFIQDLASRVDGIDVDKSLFMTVFGFITTKGTEYRCPNALSFAEAFNKEFGDIIDGKHTRTAGGRGKFIVSYLDQPIKEVKEPVIESPVKPEKDSSTEDKTVTEEKPKAKKASKYKSKAKTKSTK